MNRFKQSEYQPFQSLGGSRRISFRCKKRPVLAPISAQIYSYFPRAGTAQDAEAAGCMHMLRRMVALAVKELLALLRDKKSRIVLIGPPIPPVACFRLGRDLRSE